MFTTKFWLDVLERTVKTFAQTWAALLSASGLDIIDVSSIWEQVQVSLLAALAALLMGVAGHQIGSERTAAWLPAGPDSEAGQSQIVILLAVVLLLIILLGVV